MTTTWRGVELVRAGLRRPPERVLRDLIATDQWPSVYALNDAWNLTCLDERYFEAIPGRRGRILRRLPLILAQAVEIIHRRSQIDVVVSWSEAVASSIALLMVFWPRRPAHVGVFSWISKPKKAIPLRLLKSRIDRFIVHPPLQYRFAIEHMKLSPKQAPAGFRWWVDTSFWRPLGGSSDMICCVGREMRDYATFIEAIRPLGIPCHIAAGSVTVEKSNPWLRVDDAGLPSGLTVGAKPPEELRRLYERSRFVVIPLLPSDTDNGITATLEAFAMGKPVICTLTPGQVGVLEDGVNCLRVPPEDPAALRAAIDRLWSDPALCTELGRNGRALVEGKHTIEQWVASVGAALAGAIDDRSTSRSQQSPSPR
jgi:glycosyltransferase involved in cell wall biosynthesis